MNHETLRYLGIIILLAPLGGAVLAGALAPMLRGASHWAAIAGVGGAFAAALAVFRETAAAPATARRAAVEVYDWILDGAGGAFKVEFLFDPLTAIMLLVVTGIAAMYAPGLRGRRQTAARRLAGVGWALATGVCIAAYSIIDKAGVARLHPLAYISLMGVGMSVLLAPFVLRRRVALAHEWRVNGRAIAVASSMNLTSYLLVLFAFRLSKAGYVVAARETSIVFSVLIGSLLMREGHLGPRLVGAMVVLIGVAGVALAR